MYSTKELHTNTKITITDAKVYRVEYPVDDTFDVSRMHYSKMIMKISNSIQATWGYSKLVAEITKPYEAIDLQVPSGIPAAQITALVGANLDYGSSIRGYIYFKDEMDALQFLLGVDVKTIKVSMWPHNISFTTYKFT